MRPSLVIRLPIYVLVNGGLVDGQTGNLIRKADVRKRRRSRTEDSLPCSPLLSPEKLSLLL